MVHHVREKKEVVTHKTSTLRAEWMGVYSGFHFSALCVYNRPLEGLINPLSLEYAGSINNVQVAQTDWGTHTKNGNFRQILPICQIAYY